jgi:hypothetical protein
LQHTDKSSAGKQRQPAELVAKVFLLGGERANNARLRN